MLIFYTSEKHQPPNVFWFLKVLLNRNIGQKSVNENRMISKI